MDQLTNLRWRRAADLVGAVTWAQALAAVARLNEQAGRLDGWRLPNINELESLADCSTYSPALPAAYPFTAVQEVYWSSTTSLYADWAWALYLNNGAVGVGLGRQTAATALGTALGASAGGLLFNVGFLAGAPFVLVASIAAGATLASVRLPGRLGRVAPTLAQQETAP